MTTEPGASPKPRRRREAALIALMAVQVLCSAFFIADVIGDTLEAGSISAHLDLEMLANLGLLAGIVVEGLVLRAMLAREARTAQALSVARGALATLMQQRFETWGLTPSEADVAGFTIKGCTIAEVARLRGSSEATVKTHLNAVYRKAGVSGRGQLVSLFIEDLLVGPIEDGLAESETIRGGAIAS